MFMNEENGLRGGKGYAEAAIKIMNIILLLSNRMVAEVRHKALAFLPVKMDCLTSISHI